jgi:hypothetical protein
VCGRRLRDEWGRPPSIPDKSELFSRDLSSTISTVTATAAPLLFKTDRAHTRERGRRFEFPNPVNETSARLVAAGVVAQGVVFLAIRQWWVLVPLFAGFVARVLNGPRFSPLGLLVTKLITPRLPGPHQFVAGPPKRFAQFVGVLFSGGALLAWGLGAPSVSVGLIIGLVIAATMEAVFAFCLGCTIFSVLMRLGAIPEDVCLECANVGDRLAAAHAASSTAA